MADPIPSLTRIERRLAHALGFMAVSRLSDDRMDLVVKEMRHVLQALPRRAENERLVASAEAICAAFPRRNMRGPGGMEWMTACLDADRAVQAFHWAGFCALQEGSHAG